MKAVLFTLMILCFVPRAHAQQQHKPRFMLDAPQYGAGINQQGPVHQTPEGYIEPFKELDYAPTPEPIFGEVKFLKIETSKDLAQRVESLTHGILMDIPPEYDHYGHEIRRYMSSVAGPNVLGDPERMREELKNIARAKVILKYWRESLFKEVKAVEKEIEEVNASSNIRSSFKYHKGRANAFFVEAESWMNNNAHILRYLLEIGPKAYRYDDPTFKFKDAVQLQKFAAIYDSRERALKQMHGYTPFLMMIY